MNFISNSAFNPNHDRNNGAQASTSAAVPPPLPVRPAQTVPPLPKEEPKAGGSKKVASKVGKVLGTGVMVLFGVFVVTAVIGSVIHDVSAWASGSFALSAGTLFVIYSLIFKD